jgi:hypothetical protein
MFFDGIERMLNAEEICDMVGKMMEKPYEENYLR